jgi:hypothetical protein
MGCLYTNLDQPAKKWLGPRGRGRRGIFPMAPGGEVGQIRLAGGDCHWGTCSRSTPGPSGARLGCKTGKRLTGVGGRRQGRQRKGEVQWQRVRLVTGVGRRVEENRCTQGNLLEAAAQLELDWRWWVPCGRNGGRWTLLPSFVGRWLGPKAGANGRGEDGGVDAQLGRQREKAVVADDGERQPNSGGRAEAKATVRRWNGSGGTSH